MSAWQPIESAPKHIVYTDGRHRHGPYILVWSGGEVKRARWWDANNEGETKYCNWIADGGHAVHPTHWQPLPDPPVSP
jgi:hypothetical protein